MLKRLLLGFLLIFIAPLATHAAWHWYKGWPESWKDADWSSANMLPLAQNEPEAVVYVMAARIGRWRGMAAHHSWLVVKRAGAAKYTRYDVVGWGKPIRIDAYAADGRWYGQDPAILVALRGQAAAVAIPKIEAAVAAYPYPKPGTYQAWPGPNSNTFVAAMATAVPELAAGLLPTAIGKDFHEGGYAGLTPSQTGLQVNYRGALGLTVGWVEGAEMNILGLVAGLDVRRPAIKLPGWGRIGMSPR